jgi:hypothetical protein
MPLPRSRAAVSIGNPDFAQSVAAAGTAGSAMT